jgi:hypothetical protein
MAGLEMAIYWMQSQYIETSRLVKDQSPTSPVPFSMERGIPSQYRHICLKCPTTLPRPPASLPMTSRSPGVSGAVPRLPTSITTTMNGGSRSQDDRRLFEKICLEGFQAGLSWLTILNKREAFRAGFANFEMDEVAKVWRVRQQAPVAGRWHCSPQRQDCFDHQQREARH